MKTKFWIPMLIILIWALAACSDGSAKMAIPFRTDTTDNRIILVNDSVSNNGIYVDTDNLKVYCPSGPNEVIELPEGAYKTTVSTGDVAINAETLCEIGQEGFFLMLKPFGLIEPEGK